ncbi:MAG: ABC transporter ATP-binding protein/permease [Gammaproteobacteria bacterium]|nr:ABC transporter ATP-binding protein/permease [Gammaproteobacteria bacterium]
MQNLRSNSPLEPVQYSWNVIFALAWEHKKVLLIGHLIAILAALVMIPIPLLMPLLVDEVLLNRPDHLVAAVHWLLPANWHGPVLVIVLVMLLTILLRVAGVLFSVLQTRQFSLVAKDICFRIRQDIIANLRKVSMKEYETLGSGVVASHMVTDVQAVDDFITNSLSRFIVAVLTIIGVAAVLLYMQWQLALFILFMNPLVIFFTMLLGKKVKQLKAKENKAFEIFQQTLNETMDAIQQIRTSNRERHYLKQLLDKAQDIKTHSAAYSWRSDAANRLSFLVFLLGFEVFRAVSMVLVLISELTLGQMFAVYAYLWFMMTPVQDILGVQYSAYSAKASLKRINRLLTLEHEPDYPALVNPFINKQTVSVQLESLHFRYGDEAILNGVSLQIKEAEKVAFVGASGGGKSTLVQVILGLYQPQKGRVCFDHVAVSEIGLDVVRENVATVLQQPVLLNGSIRENLGMGLSYPDDAIWQALNIAQLDDYVKSLGDQLETIVGRNGVRLSGGQRQRLAIARMILSKPKVVILDEATSALDSETEARLHQAMQAFLQQRTTIIIAHRLSAVRQADKVFVFDNGQIIDEGHHNELIGRDGLYKELYAKH